jgi:hypothetical protein
VTFSTSSPITNRDQLNSLLQQIRVQVATVSNTDISNVQVDYVSGATVMSVARAILQRFLHLQEQTSITVNIYVTGASDADIQSKINTVVNEWAKEQNGQTSAFQSTQVDTALTSAGFTSDQRATFSPLTVDASTSPASVALYTCSDGSKVTNPNSCSGAGAGPNAGVRVGLTIEPFLMTLAVLVLAWAH